MTAQKMKLNDGGRIPLLGFGTWKLSAEEALKYGMIDRVLKSRTESSVA